MEKKNLQKFIRKMFENMITQKEKYIVKMVGNIFSNLQARQVFDTRIYNLWSLLIVLGVII
jgi:hypothetical protein